jgi:NADH-quinone oxidoreductase subunit J
VVLEAQTIAVFQVLVYAGAVVVLISFVLMLMGSGPRDAEPVDIIKDWRAVVGLVLSFALLLVFGYGMSLGQTRPADHAVDPTRFGQLEGLGQALLGGYVVPFEVISLLLMVAIVGAVALLRKAPARGEEEGEP